MSQERTYPLEALREDLAALGFEHETLQHLKNQSAPTQLAMIEGRMATLSLQGKVTEAMLDPYLNLTTQLKSGTKLDIAALLALTLAPAANVSSPYAWLEDTVAYLHRDYYLSTAFDNIAINQAENAHGDACKAEHHYEAFMANFRQSERIPSEKADEYARTIVGARIARRAIESAVNGKTYDKILTDLGLDGTQFQQLMLGAGRDHASPVAKRAFLRWCNEAPEESKQALLGFALLHVHHHAGFIPRYDLARAFVPLLPMEEKARESGEALIALQIKHEGLLAETTQTQESLKHQNKDHAGLLSALQEEMQRARESLANAQAEHTRNERRLNEMNAHIIQIVQKAADDEKAHQAAQKASAVREERLSSRVGQLSAELSEQQKHLDAQKKNARRWKATAIVTGALATASLFAPGKFSKDAPLPKPKETTWQDTVRVDSIGNQQPAAVYPTSVSARTP